jgi:hypothetical protein
MEVSGQLLTPVALERTPGGHWMGPRAVLDAVEKRKISYPFREMNSSPPASSPSLYRLSYPVLPKSSLSSPNILLCTLFPNTFSIKVKEKLFLYRPWRPLGLREV